MAVVEMIYALDEISVRPGMQTEYETAYRKVYVPLALARGMTLVHAWMTPPVALEDAPNSLIFVWSVPDPAAWWRMRYGAYDPNVSAFWQDTAYLVLTRRRIFMQPLLGSEGPQND